MSRPRRSKKSDPVDELNTELKLTETIDEEDLRLLEESGEYANQECPETPEDLSDFLERNEKLIHAIVKPYRGLDDYDDLFQEASIGFLKGIRTYRASCGVKVTTYAFACAKNEVRMYLRKGSAKSRTATVISLEASLDGDDDSRDNMLNRDLEGMNPLNDSRSLDEIIHTNTLYDMAMDIVKTEMSPTQQTVIQEFLKGTPQSQTAKKLHTSQSEISKILKTTICELRLKMQQLGIVDTN